MECDIKKQSMNVKEKCVANSVANMTSYLKKR